MKLISLLSSFILISSVSLNVWAQQPKKTSKKTSSKKISANKKSTEPEISAVAGDPVSEVRIEGNKKIEKDAIFNQIQTKKGDGLSLAMIREDVKRIYSTGYFENVEVEKNMQGGQAQITFHVIERPSVAEILYEGNVEVKDEDLATATGLKSYEILNQAKIKEAEEKIQKLYEEKGYFLVKIKSSVTDVKKGETVKLRFDLEENEQVRVKKITFLGNSKLTDSSIKDKMLTQEGGYFSFMGGGTTYRQDAFERDVQLIRYLYYSEGYVQAKIDRPQVYVSPDKKYIFITIRIEEGDQFSVGDIEFTGDLLFSRDELLQTIDLDESKIFSYQKMQNDSTLLQAKYGDLGYAFTNVNLRTKIDNQEKKVNVAFEFDKGQKAYFRFINMVGDSKTRDKVIRRELKIHEGELYNETRKKESLENIQRLGFFEDVNFKQSTPPEAQDRIDIDIVVKERGTGTLQFGAGYASSTGMTLQGQVSQTNFLGKGQSLSASLNLSSERNDFRFSFEDPHYNDTDWSTGYTLFQSQISRSEYIQHSTGGSIEFGHPVADYTRLFLSINGDNTDLRPVYDSDHVLITDYELFPLDEVSGNTFSLKSTIIFDKRNDRFSPSKGAYLSGSVEYAGLGGDINYTRSIVNMKYFKKIFWDVVFRNNLSYGIVQANRPGEDVPFNETFRLGGPYSLRGYYFVGKRVKSNHLLTKYLGDPNYTNRYTPSEIQKLSMRPYGGTQQLYYTAELEFPLVAEAGIKGVVFYDIGQAEDEITEDNFYSDVGFGFRWFSPIGPLRFEWGIPLRRDPIYDQPSVFEFSIGAPF